MTSTEGIDFDEVEASVRRALDDSRAKLIGFSAEPLSKQWGGMMGRHFSLSARVSVTSSDATSSNDRQLAFFAKTPADSLATKSVVDERLSPEEVNFFQSVYPRMRASEKWSPRCHFASRQLLVLEDLRLKGFAIRASGLFDETSLAAAVDTLASFHASSIALEKEMGGRRLDDAYPGAFREKIFCEGESKCARANRIGFETLSMLAEDFGLEASIVPRILARICEIVRPRTGQCNVICHGDLWRSNIMFADGSSKFPSCLLVDYQMLRYASPALDLAMLLYVHTHPESYRSISQRNNMLLRYEKSLRQALIDLGVEDTFSRDIVRDFDRCKLMGAAQASTRWPPIVFSCVMRDPVALEKWYFRERIGVYRDYMKQNPDYEGMMREYLVQLIDEGKRALSI